MEDILVDGFGRLDLLDLFREKTKANELEDLMKGGDIGLNHVASSRIHNVGWLRSNSSITHHDTLRHPQITLARIETIY